MFRPDELSCLAALRERERFKDECGIVGVHGHAEASNIAYLALYALQHRGQESAGICSTQGGEQFVHRAMGLVADVFSEISGESQAARYGESSGTGSRAPPTPAPKARSSGEPSAAYGENTLAMSDIPLASGTVTVRGNAIPAGHQVYVAGQPVPVDPQGNFVAQEILPSGVHTVEVAVLDPYGIEFVSARDIDQQLGLRQPHVEHRHERLPARQNARTFAMALQQRGRLLGAVGTHIVKHGRFHERTPRRCKSRCHHDARAATPPEACRPSDSKSCATMSRAALSSMRLPTMATLPPTWAL